MSESSNTDAREPKLAYESPTLASYGSIASLTLAGRSVGPDVGGRQA